MLASLARASSFESVGQRASFPHGTPSDSASALPSEPFFLSASRFPLAALLAEPDDDDEEEEDDDDEDDDFPIARSKWLANVGAFSSSSCTGLSEPTFIISMIIIDGGRERFTKGWIVLVCIHVVGCSKKGWKEADVASSPFGACLRVCVRHDTHGVACVRQYVSSSILAQD